MVKSAPRPKHGGVPNWLKFSVLIVLAAVVLGLSAFALTQQTEVEGAGTVLTLPTPKPESAPQPVDEPETPSYVAPVAQRLLLAGPEPGHVLRATMGGCPEPAGLLEVSFDHGGAWTAGVTASVDARRILQLDTSDREIVRMTSLNGECTPVASRSFVGGTSWEPTQASGWFIDPSNPQTVHAPELATLLSCTAVDLSSQGTSGVVLCSDSTVFVSEDDGVTWSEPVAVPNAVAVGITQEGYAVASFGEAECAGVRTRLLADGVLSAAGACVDTPEAGNGQTAVAGGPEGWYLWVGPVFLRSLDQGLSWG